MKKIQIFSRYLAICLILPSILSSLQIFPSVIYGIPSILFAMVGVIILVGIEFSVGLQLLLSTHSKKSLKQKTQLVLTESSKIIQKYQVQVFISCISTIWLLGVVVQSFLGPIGLSEVAGRNLTTLFQLEANISFEQVFQAQADNLGILYVPIKTNPQDGNFPRIKLSWKVWSDNQLVADSSNSFLLHTPELQTSLPLGIPLQANSKDKEFLVAITIDSIDGEVYTFSDEQQIKIEAQYISSFKKYILNFEWLHNAWKEILNQKVEITILALVSILSLATQKLVSSKNDFISVPILLSLLAIGLSPVLNLHNIFIFSLSCGLLLLILLGLWLNTNKQQNLNFPKVTLFLKPIVLALFIGFGLFLAHAHWFDVDEGRLLYSSWLIVEGFKPYVDFYARAPFLIYLLSPLTWISDNYLFIGRYINIVFLTLFWITTYIILKICAPKKSDLMIVLVLMWFMFHPWMSSFVAFKTQTGQLLFNALAILLTLLGAKKKKNTYLVLAGLSLGAGYLIRDSSIAVLLGIGGWLYLQSASVHAFLKKVLSILMGFLPITILVRFILLDTSITTGVSLMESDFQIWDFMSSFNVLFPLTLFCLAAFIYILIKISYKFFKNIFSKDSIVTEIDLIVVTFITNSSLLIAFGLLSQFFSGYVRELLLYLVVLAAYALIKLSKTISSKTVAACFVVAVLLGSYVLSSWQYMQGYQNSDSLQLYSDQVFEVTSIIQQETTPDEYILAGTPIWAFTSQRHNFAYISHLNDLQTKDLTTFWQNKIPSVLVIDYFGSEQSDTEKILKNITSFDIENYQKKYEKNNISVYTLSQ